MSARANAFDSTPRGRRLAVYVLCCAVWGSTWLVIKIGLRDLPPFHFAAMRMGLACLLMAPFALRPSRSSIPRTERLWIGICGFLQIGVAYALVFTASQWIPSSLAALLFCTFPIWVGIFGHRLLPGEPLNARTIGASALGLAGVAVIQGPEALAALRTKPDALFLGGACILASAVVSAIANVLNKRHFAGVSPYANVWGQTLVGALFLGLLAAVFEWGAPLRWTAHSASALAYTALFGTALAFAGLFWLIPRVPVAVIGTIPLTDTVIAVLLGAAVLGERLSGRELAGGALILVGVVLVVSPRPGADRVAARNA
jgi:drug/metabolite transporter (DMT)-like permease